MNPSRQEAAPHTPCPLYRKCGGCQLQNMDYPRQLHWKQEQVQRLLGRFCKARPIIGMEHPYHYRNKVQAAFAWDKRRNIVSGVYQASTHRVVPVESCMTEDETADRIMATIRGLMKGFHMTPYDEVTGRGFLRHVLVRRGFATNQVMVVMVTGTPVFPAKNNFCRALRQAHPEITTIVQNINDRYTSMVLGEREKVLWGRAILKTSSAAVSSGSPPGLSIKSTRCRQKSSTAQPLILRASPAKRRCWTLTAALGPSAWPPPNRAPAGSSA